MTLGEFAFVYNGDAVVKLHRSGKGWMDIYDGNLDNCPMLYSQNKIGTIAHQSDKVEIYLSNED